MDEMINQLSVCALRRAFFYSSSSLEYETKEKMVARKTILVCDNCGKEVPESVAPSCA